MSEHIPTKPHLLIFYILFLEQKVLWEFSREFSEMYVRVFEINVEAFKCTLSYVYVCVYVCVHSLYLWHYVWGAIQFLIKNQTKTYKSNERVQHFSYEDDKSVCCKFVT